MFAATAQTMHIDRPVVPRVLLQCSEMKHCPFGSHTMSRSSVYCFAIADVSIKNMVDTPKMGMPNFSDDVESAMSELLRKSVP